MTHPDHLLVIDGTCGFCRWSAERILRHDRDGRVRAVAMHESDGRDAIAGLDSDVAAASWHLRTPDGRLHSAGAVVAPLASVLHHGAPVAALARRFPRATDVTYRWGAARRDVWGRMLRRAQQRRFGEPGQSG